MTTTTGFTSDPGDTKRAFSGFPSGVAALAARAALVVLAAAAIAAVALSVAVAG